VRFPYTQANDCTKTTPCSIGKAKAAPDAQRGLPRGLYGEGGHAHREKTRPADLEDTVSTAGAGRICRTAYFCKTREDRDTSKEAPARRRPTLLFGPLDASEIGLLSGITSQEHAEVSSTEPRGPYLYIRPSAARARGVRHQVFRGLFAGAPVLQSLAGHNPLVCVKLLYYLRLIPEHVDVDVVDFSPSR